MKKVNRKVVQISLILFACTAFLFLVNAQGVQEWVVPAKFKTMKNPTTASKENIASGKDLYNKHCKSCHGSAGLGDGTKAATLDVPPGDFTLAKFQSQTDGEIFYKITEGKGKMPSFKKTIPDDNERWSMVHYIRTFKGK